VPAGLLPVEPVVFLEDVREGVGLSEEEQGQLVSGVLHGAGQLAGDRRPVLAA
jgi:hypothetical protein